MSHYRRAAKVDASQAEIVTFACDIPCGVPSKKNALAPGSRGKRMHYRANVKKGIADLVVLIREKWLGKYKEGECFTDAYLDVHFGVTHLRSDLDNSLVTITDALVQAGVLCNDSMAHLRGVTATYEWIPVQFVNLQICGRLIVKKWRPRRGNG